MSGGHFDYEQDHMRDAAGQLRTYIAAHGSEYGESTIRSFVECAHLLEMAAIYLQRVDWLISGDDGEDDFHARLRNDLRALGANE